MRIPSEEFTVMTLASKDTDDPEDHDDLCDKSYIVERTYIVINVI